MFMTYCNVPSSRCLFTFRNMGTIAYTYLTKNKLPLLNVFLPCGNASCHAVQRFLLFYESFCYCIVHDATKKSRYFVFLMD